MMKKLLLTSCMVFMLTTVASAQLPKLHVKNLKEVPASVQQFLKTPVGRQFTAEQVMAVMNQPAVKAPKKAVTSEVKVDEDFSKFTAGTEAEPDATDLGYAEQSALDALTKQPGWTAWHVFQAGGKAYQGYVDTAEGDPGYFMTPNQDLTAYQGVFRVKFRTKNVNPNNETGSLQYFVLDQTESRMISAAGLPMANEWTDNEIIVSGGLAKTSIMFFGWQGRVMVSNVTIEQLNYPLDTPQGISVEVAGGGKLKVKWDAVEGATSYVVTASERIGVGESSPFAETEVNGTEATIEGVFNPVSGVLVRVVAKNGADESYPGVKYEEALTVASVATPVALPATNVTENGFTANWEQAQNANDYRLTLIRTHKVTEDGEMITYFDDDFLDIPYTTDDHESTIMLDMGNPGLVSLDHVLNYPGWGTFLAVAANGMLALTNMYEAYGIPGVLVGPEGDYSLAGGKATVSGVGMSMVDDVVVKVGFGKMQGMTPVFNEGAQEFEMSPMNPGMFSVDVAGGTPDSRLMFQIVDADPSGDMAIFAYLNISAELQKGDSYTLPYAVVDLPYDATSYDVEVPFPATDSFDYYLTASFGTTISEQSNTITVEPASSLPGPLAIAAIAKASDMVTVFNVGGQQVYAGQASGLQLLPQGIYVVRAGEHTYKVMK